MMIKAVFVGSFDPFTVGHYDIVQRALPLFDRLIIGAFLETKFGTYSGIAASPQ